MKRMLIPVALLVFLGVLVALSVGMRAESPQQKGRQTINPARNPYARAGNTTSTRPTKSSTPQSLPSPTQPNPYAPAAPPSTGAWSSETANPYSPATAAEREVERLRKEYVELARQHAQLLDAESLQQEVDDINTRIGELVAENRVTAVIESLNEVVKQYPDSAAAKNARQMLGIAEPGAADEGAFAEDFGLEAVPDSIAPASGELEIPEQVAPPAFNPSLSEPDAAPQLEPPAPKLESPSFGAPKASNDPPSFKSS